MIPPSVIFVIYGIATEQSISRLLISGVVPGILLTLAYMLTIYIICKRNPELGPKRPGPRASFQETFDALKGGLFGSHSYFYHFSWRDVCRFLYTYRGRWSGGLWGSCGHPFDR
ncbi:MAG: TRAP transporter large permease subunit [Thermincola sp.]|nr:TRAP transporter large permease subunit [Thermincola sp.]